MKKYKNIILGPQCSGKTTLKKYLGSKYNLPFIEEDEIFTDLNGGKYPKDIEYKETILRPKLEEKIRASDSIIFLSSYCDRDLLMDLRSKGFKVIQLVLEKDEFTKRNERRMLEHGADDANVWAKQIFDFHKSIEEEGFIDMKIDANQPTEDIAKSIMDFIE